MKRAALYARVSKKKRRKDGDASGDAPPPELLPEAQIRPLVAFARTRGFEIVPDEDGSACFIDNGVSGGRASRPALNRMMACVRAGRVDAVVCVKLDRIARSLVNILHVGQELESLGVDLVAIDQKIDTTTPGGKFMFNVFGAFAELERDLCRERSAAGVDAARAAGKRIGRPPTLTPKHRERIRRMRVEGGRNLDQIVAAMGCSKTVVWREVKRLDAIYGRPEGLGGRFKARVRSD